MKKEICERLVEIRLENKMTQEAMAELLEISCKHYGTIERGKTALDIEKLEILIDKLNVDINYLVTGKRLNTIDENKKKRITSSSRELKEQLEKFLKEVE